MRAEFEERQKNSPMNSILSAQQGGNPLGDFDLAGMLAGSNKESSGKKKK
jgi:ER membrane protein complex subunit 7